MKNNTRKLLIALNSLFLSCAFFMAAQAQPFSNSWINFGNSYYKFRITDEGIYRISKSQLDAIGMGAVTGNQFAIFRDGLEVPIYTSTNGAFGSSDFIEFYGTKADGKMDQVMYPDPYSQPNDEVNVISDTAYYFITYDNGVHQRMQMVNNSIPVPAPAVSPYCWYTSYAGGNPRAAWNPGRSHTDQTYFYSSDFDLGEGFGYIYNQGSYYFNFLSRQVYYAGPPSVLNFAWSEQSISGATNPGHLYVTIGNNGVFDTALNNTFRTIKRSVSFPANLLADNISTVSFNDAYISVLHKCTVKYPRTYNFTGGLENKTPFQIPANDRYIEITNFNSGTDAPELYDLTNNKIYKGVVAGGILKFYLDVSLTPRDVFLTNSASISPAQNFNQVQFRDYNAAANQGDYVILSHKDYINATPNNINEFRNYRSSLSGGGYHPVVVDVAELYDQFAYGHDFHPLSVRNFIAYANSVWTIKPKFLFIVGKGISYSKYMTYKQAAPGTYPYAVVPTWGDPGSDNLFSSFNNDQKPILATGRLSAWNNQEIADYLKKLKDYETAITPLPVPTVEHEFWKKNVLHVAGATDATLQAMLLSTLNECKTIIEDTLVGAKVVTVKKTSTDPVDQQNNATIDSMMNRGLRNISYYGHGSSSGFEFGLNTPDDYNYAPKFPVFSSFACEIAHIFDLSTSARTISEKYINSAGGGSIAMIAGDNTGWTGTLPGYMTNIYKSWAYRDYSKTLGEQYRNNIAFIQSNPLYSDDFMDIHTQCMLYQGDPALKIYNPDMVDWVVEETGISSIPTNVTTELDSFDIKVILYSLGRSTRDSVWVRLQHTLQGSTNVLYTDSVKIANLLASDTIIFRVPLDATTDIGLNNYTVKIDCNDAFTEMSEQNNEAKLQIFIYSENLVPVYPKEYAIVHNQGVTLKASTLNAFAPSRRYKMEIDTTEFFNSTLKRSTEVTSTGGVIKWTPDINYVDSTVYYWRAAPDTLINGSPNWSGSSFVYLANGSDGWNQSHYFQYKDDEPYYGLALPSGTRQFRFSPVVPVVFRAQDKVIDIGIGNFVDVAQSVDNVTFDISGCLYPGSIQFVVIDSVLGKPWLNGPITGKFGSNNRCRSDNPPLERKMFEFSTGDAVSRNKARIFLKDSVPDGSYVMVKNMIMHHLWDHVTIDTFKSDSAIYGSGNTLYHAIKDLGFDEIDQFTSEKVFIFFRKKGDNSYPIQQHVSIGKDDKIEMTAVLNRYTDTATMESSLIGPALEWQTARWRNSSLDPAEQNDSAYVEVYGVDHSENQTKLYATLAKDISLSSVDAGQYPYLRLKWFSVDNITRTSPQLDYWRVLYKPVPEAALNAASLFEYTDSLTEGQQGKLRLAIENLTPVPMDSMLVSCKVIGADGVKHDLAQKRFKKLTGNDTLVADFDLDVSAYHGNNFIFVEANPGNDQPEQYHPNNLGYLPLFMEADKLNPVLDVTFDGIHILDKDIVSAKPMIKVLMRDENKYLALNDTALMKVQLVYPGQSTAVDIPMDGTICKFIPAQIVNGHKNEARVEFKPTLAEDGVYKLIVSGKDKVGNIAGNMPKYQVNFTVENKPSITNVLNYPNPFSTSTQFIFTMTGSEIPSQFKIQIISVSGKVVREIKKSELGDLHIGRNMTEYRWDGKDEFGQMLGNGVYLYRVITSIRGESIEQRKNANVDKYFKNGYGKLYIMR